MKRHSTVVSVILAACLFPVADHFQRPLLDYRAASRPTTPLMDEQVSPLMTFLPVALGGFRGIMADVFWLRLTMLQDQGSYMEIMQLADWITLLIPHAPEVWSYQAWNMSFNISAAMHDNSDRWKWVRRGIDLLTREAIQRSPDKTQVQLEIGRIYQHKIASSFDRTHRYYQEMLAQSIDPMIPSGRLDHIDDVDVTRNSLSTGFGMKLSSMQDVESLYGTLDWRHASSHAIYWAYSAGETARDDLTLNCDRMIYQSLADLFRKGLITGMPPDGAFDTAPDLSRFETCCRTFEHAIRRHHASDTSAGYINFLKSAVRLFHDAGRMDDSRMAFEQLKSQFPEQSAGLSYDMLLQPE